MNDAEALRRYAAMAARRERDAEQAALRSLVGGVPSYRTRDSRDGGYNDPRLTNYGDPRPGSPGWLGERLGPGEDASGTTQPIIGAGQRFEQGLGWDPHERDGLEPGGVLRATEGTAEDPIDDGEEAEPSAVFHEVGGEHPEDYELVEDAQPGRVAIVRRGSDQATVWFYPAPGSGGARDYRLGRDGRSGKLAIYRRRDRGRLRRLRGEQDRLRRGAGRARDGGGSVERQMLANLNEINREYYSSRPGSEFFGRRR